MAARKKHTSETLQRYLIELRELGKTGGLEDAAIIQYCVDGINDLKSNKQILYGCTRIDEFKLKLKLYEEISSKMSKKYVSVSAASPAIDATRSRASSSAVPSSESRKSRPSSRIRCFQCKSIGHTSKECPNKGKGYKCFRCEEFGHMASSCPNSKGQPKIGAIIEKLHEYNGSMLKQIVVGSKKLMAMIDSGSDLNLVSESRCRDIYDGELENTIINFSGVGSKGLRTKGRFATKVTVDGESYETYFHVVEDQLLPVEIIVGKELMKQTITILTPESVIMKKFVPENTVLALTAEEEIDLSHLKDPQTANEVRKLIVNYVPKKCVVDTTVQMKIILLDEKPIHQSPRRLSPLESDIVRKQIDEWLSEGLSDQVHHRLPVQLCCQIKRMVPSAFVWIIDASTKSS